MSHGSRLADWNSFPQARPGSRHFGIPLPIPGMAKRQIFLAGLETWTGRTFQVFAINCAHLGCPVRWFPQSNLFMCPCHGGVYYSDGSHAAGPPPRGLFQYHYRIEDGKLFIKARRNADNRESNREYERSEAAVRLIGTIGALARSAPQAWRGNSRNGRAPCPPQYRELALCLRQRRAHRFPSSGRHRHSSCADLRTFRRRGLEQPADSQSQHLARMVHSSPAWLGFELHDRHCPGPHDSGLPLRRL